MTKKDLRNINAPRKSRYLNTAEAGEFLGVAPSTLTIWRCVKRYPLPYLKIGGAVRYDEADLIAFVESRKVRPALQAV
jgi:predicted DNA-binding transcriptional regulator AlpA